MDQFVALVNRIVTAINKINTSIQKLPDYITGNTYSIKGKGIAESSGSSGVLGFLRVTTLMRGITAATSGISGFLNHHLFSGGITGSSGVESILTGTWIIRGSVVESSNTIVKLNILTKIVGSSISISSGVAATLRNATVKISGSSSAGSVVFGSLA